MTTWLLEAIFYAAMAAAVLYVNRHRALTRWAGAALLIFTVVSSVTFFCLRGPDYFHLRVMREILMVTPLATLFAYLLFAGDADRPYRYALAICLVDVALCGAVFLNGSTAIGLRSFYGIGININFAGLCACIAAPGVRDAYLDWIAAIKHQRSMDSSAPDMDWALRSIDRNDRS